MNVLSARGGRRNAAAAATGLVIVLVSAKVAHADVTISMNPTANMSCSGGLCAPTATDAALNVNDLENLLASGNVKVTTTGSGVQADNIDVLAPLSWSSAGALTLDAYQSIAVDAPVSVESLAGLTLTTNDGGTNGTLSFGDMDDVSFANLSSNLTINGASYTLVNTVQTLAAAIAANPSGNYALAASYDASQDGTYNTVPIPTTLAGTMEGLGNFIENLTVDDEVDYNVGLFAQNSGLLRDLGVPFAKVISVRNDSNGSVGTLVGTNSGTVAGCHGSGSVTVRTRKRGQASVGGLVGTNTDTIINSHASASLSLLGDRFYGGGLVGANSGTIGTSHASGDITESGKFGSEGGLVGSDYGSINVAFATGNVTGGQFVGGLAGEIGTSISNTFATGSVQPQYQRHLFVGGLVGVAYETVNTSYSLGAVGYDVVGGPKKCSGGSFGRDNYRQQADSSVYWDVTTSQTSRGVGCGHYQDHHVIGLTTDQLKSGLPKGFDPAIWGEQKGINHGFPYLLAIPPK